MTGIDQLLLLNNYKNNRIGLLSNSASVTATGTCTRVALLQHGFQLVQLFSPEHGLAATGADGEWQADTKDAITGIPVTSLYGSKLAPGKKDLLDIDLVVVDLPDIGCRFYTYLWTMTYMMEACAAYGIPMLITDRLNPSGMNFDLSEGPMLNEASCASFIGRWCMPIRHCCTMGELALYFAATRMKSLSLKIISAGDDPAAVTATNKFIPTSPAMQNISTAMLYPGTGLMEGINVNEGRGTNHPFEVFGAPWINAEEVKAAFDANQLEGIKATTITYSPQSSLYAGETCYGLQLNITDFPLFRPVKTGITLLQILLRLYPHQVKERLYATVANPGGTRHLDKLLGIPDALQQLANGIMPATLIAGKWKTIMENYLLYQR